MSRIFSWMVVPAFLLLTSVSQAHFPWLVKDKEGKAVLYFGENLADKTYKIPDSIASAKIFATNAKGESREVATQRVETTELFDGFGCSSLKHINRSDLWYLQRWSLELLLQPRGRERSAHQSATSFQLETGPTGRKTRCDQLRDRRLRDLGWRAA